MKQSGLATENAPHKHLYSRISYLHQAAAYLTYFQLRKAGFKNHHINFQLTLISGNNKSVKSGGLKEVHASTDQVRGIHGEDGNMPDGQVQLTEGASPVARHILGNLRGIALKTQANLSCGMKHTICKRCEAFLIPGATSSSTIENKSTGGIKRWADVLVVTCHACNASSRYPVGAKRQRRKEMRKKASESAKTLSE